MLRHFSAPILIGLFFVIGCDGTDTNPPPAGSTTTSTGTTSGTSMGGSGGSGGTGAGGATSSSGGSGGTGGSDLCGNNKLDAGELCDGNELGGATCESLSFSGGTLSCKGDCTFNIGNCTGAETCDDGIDNDGDGLIDCDEDECAPSCNDSCLMPVVLGDPDDSPGSTIGHASVLKSSCVQQSGPEITYSITATTTGMLDVVLVEDGSAAFSLSLRTDCASDASEVACTVAYSAGGGFDKKLSVPVTAGDKLFIVVDGDGQGAAGSFTVGVQSRPILCGDAIQDPVETCDDGNTVAGDGCSSTCILEADETEPNNTIATANAYQMPFIGAINPEGDVDYIQYNIAASAGLLIAVNGLGDAACTDGSMDSYITLYDAAGTKLAENDDGAPGSLCSITSKPALPPGSYFIKVEASPTAPPGAATFPYSLSIIPFQCGDGTVQLGEECDDAGTINGDGCSSTCTFEVTESEPNDTLMTADVYSMPWVGRIDPDNEVDVVSINVPGPASKVTAKTGSPDGGLCFPGADSFIQILKSDGTTLAENDDNGTYCSTAIATGLAAGKVYIRVRAQPTLDVSNIYVFPYSLIVTVE